MISAILYFLVHHIHIKFRSNKLKIGFAISFYPYIFLFDFNYIQYLIKNCSERKLKRFLSRNSLTSIFLELMWL